MKPQLDPPHLFFRKSESDEPLKKVRVMNLPHLFFQKCESDETAAKPSSSFPHLHGISIFRELSFATAQGFTDGWDEVDIRWDEVEPIHGWDQNSMSMSIVFQLLKHNIYSLHCGGGR